MKTGMESRGVVALVLGVVMACRAALGVAAAQECDRSCLEGMAEKYLTAMPTHDPGRAPIAYAARYAENTVELTLPDGLWRTVDSIDRDRLFVIDPQQGQVGFFFKAMENGAPVLVATRLEVVNGRITEIESFAPRLGATISGGPGSTPRVDQLGDVTRQQFTTPLPPGKRRSREQLANIANSYYTGLENEIFQINAQGQISQVEAVLLPRPYGIRPGWHTGVPMRSPQAGKDGFNEY